MDRTGWNAVIYDVDWARFKTGQDGIAVYNNGKECESMTENENMVIVEADPNESFLNDKIGHILFKQKGSDKISIVCFKIGASTVIYGLTAKNNNLSLYLCDIESSGNVVSYALENANLSVVGNDGTYLDYNQIKNDLVVTKFKPDFYGGIERIYTIVVEYQGSISPGIATTIYVSTVSPPDEQINPNSNNTKIEATLKSCSLISSIISTNNNTTIDCSGGTVQYSIERKYNIEIDPTGSQYQYMKCEQDIEGNVSAATDLFLTCNTEGAYCEKNGKNKVLVTIKDFTTNNIEIIASLPFATNKTTTISNIPL